MANRNQVQIDPVNNTIIVSQPITEIVKIATIGPQGPVGPTGPQGPSGSLILSGSIDNDVTITGSVEILGSLTITGSINGEFTGSLLGTSSNAISASYALSASLSQTASYVETAQTASYVETAQTASYVLNAISASFAQTASYLNPLTQDVQITGSLGVINSITATSFTGSFSGSFEGDGSGLTQIPASGIVGLNLSQIATTNVTASVNEGTDSFKIVSGSETPFKINNNGIISGTGSGLLDLKATETDLQQELITNQTVGGVSSGETFAIGTNVEDLLRQILITFIRSIISNVLLRNGGGNVSTGVREVNSSITTDQFKITVAQNSPNNLTPINLSLTGSGATTGNFENDYSSTTLTDGTNNITISPDEVLNINSISTANSANITITAKAQDPTDSVILTTSQNYTYVYPIYSGVTVTDLSSATGTILETYLTKLVATKGTKNITLDPDDEFIYFAYPSRYGDLTSIKDGNSFENLPNFTKYTRTINGGNGWSSVSYNIYKLNTVTDIPSQTFTFTF